MTTKVFVFMHVAAESNSSLWNSVLSGRDRCVLRLPFLGFHHERGCAGGAYLCTGGLSIFSVIAAHHRRIRQYLRRPAHRQNPQQEFWNLISADDGECTPQKERYLDMREALALHTPHVLVTPRFGCLRRRPVAAQKGLEEH
jgi:hypothetical protein